MVAREREENGIILGRTLKMGINESGRGEGAERKRESWRGGNFMGRAGASKTANCS
jgi:hypothetical protein